MVYIKQKVELSMSKAYNELVNPCKGCEGVTKLAVCEACSHYQSGDAEQAAYSDMTDEANGHLIKALELLRDIKMDESEIETFFLEFLEEY